MEYRYKTRGVCSSEILLELDGDVVKSGTSKESAL